MKALKIVLGIIYPILIILLLLLGLKKCDNPQQEPEEPVNPVNPTPPPHQNDSNDVRRAENVGASGDLKITLLWDFGGDIDLHVVQPSGREIYFGNKRDSRSGATLDTDNQHGGHGAAENIYWQHPPKGRYEVALHYYDHGDGRPEQSGTCRVIVFQKGQEPKEYKVSMSQPDQMENVTTIVINN